ncbi:MAG: helix-turn-helix domain-containing protein [bacterium]
MSPSRTDRPAGPFSQHAPQPAAPAVARSNADDSDDKQTTSRDIDKNQLRAVVHPTVLTEHDCLNASELARYLRVNRKTVYEYAGSGVIPCRRLGRRLLFSRAAIAAWLARQSTPLPTRIA